MQHDPGRIPTLVFFVLAMAGLVASLFTPRRRVFVRVLPTEGGGARVEVAGLARGEDAGLAQEVDALGGGAGSSPEAPPDARARPGEELHRVGTGRAWTPSGRSEAAESSTRSTSTRTGVET